MTGHTPWSEIKHKNPPPCDFTKPHPCHDESCDGTCQFVADEYGGLTGGGDYEKWKCDVCGKITWVTLPD